MKFLYLNILILFLINYTIAEFEYIPPSREIEVIEGDSYTLGIIEDDTTNITRCYYTTDTEISGYFDVAKKAPKPPPTTTTSTLLENQLEYNFQYEYQNFGESHNNQEVKFQYEYQNFDESQNNQEVRAGNNEVTNRGSYGYCEMTIKSVDDKGPTTWTLTPYDNQTEGHVGNLTDITYKINSFYKPPLLQKTIVLYESESFFQYINVTINFQLCELTFNNSKIILPMHSTRISSFSSPYSEGDEETIKRISSFGHGFCGFKLENATSAESLVWTMTATDDQGKRYRASFRSNILRKIASSILNTKKLVVLGELDSLSCGDQYQQEFCTMYNPLGNIVFTEQTDCRYSIPTVGMDDIGVWKCITGNKYGMETVTYTVELITYSTNVKPVETWTNETDNTFTISCRLSNLYSVNGISSCKMITPNQQVLSLLPGVATNRYLPFGTDFKLGICAIEIPKPLQDFENGMWRCEIAETSTEIIGDFIDVGTTQRPVYPKHSNVTLQLGQTYKIQCQVPYSSEYCHIKAPNGTIYPTKSESEVHLGKCALNTMKINVTDNGTWTCSFARGNGLPDEEIFLEVAIAEVFQYYKTAEADVGSTAQLMCKSAGLPYKYCRFIAPNGTAYHITNHQVSNTISYYGRGLEYGECGISIANAQTSDSGYWTCVARIGRNFNQPEIRAEIMLEIVPGLLDDPNLAAAIGIAVGVVVVTSIIAMVAIQKWRRRRRHSEVAGSNIAPREMDDDNNSETLDIFSVAPPPRSYTNEETVRYDPHEHQL